MENPAAPHTKEGIEADRFVPKVLHYVWLGGKPLPPKWQANIDGWQRLMPDYRIVQWDESNYDVHQHPWGSRMYEQGKFAFASDLLRLDVLHKHGGFYLDTDMLLKKRLDPFLGEHCLWSFEFDSFLATCFLACRPGHSLIAEVMALYDRLDGPLVSNDVVTRYFLRRFPEFHLNNRDQVVGGDVRVLPKEYFVLPSFDDRKNFGVHQATNSWRGKQKKFEMGRMARSILGDVLFFKLVNQRMSWRSEYMAIDRARGK